MADPTARRVAHPRGAQAECPATELPRRPHAGRIGISRPINGHEPLYIDGLVFRNVPLPNKTQLQLRAEAFKLTNVVQFAEYHGTSAQFGTVGISQANDPRNIMVSIRVTF